MIGIGGGVIGGVVVALLIYLLPQEAAELAEIRGQLEQLGQSVAQLEQPVSDELLARVEALETAVAGEEDLPQRLEAVEGVGASLRERIASLEAATEAMPEQDVAAETAELDARLAALEERLAAIGTGDAAGVAAERVATLESELADLSATVAQLQQAVPAAGAAGDQAVTELTSRIDALEARFGQAEAARQEVETLAGRLGPVEQQVAAAQEETTGLTDEVVALSGQVGALSTRVDVLAETVDQLQERVATREDQRSRAAALALLAARLDAAIEDGEPFEDLLDSLRALDAENPAVGEAVETLAAATESGVPSLLELRRSFDRIANQIIQAARAPDGDGLLEQAAGNLMRLVTVRPVGADVEGDSAAARVARAEAALAEGDLAAAVAELETLEGAAAEAAAPWLAEAHLRLAAQAALATLQDRATGLLGETR